MKTSVIYYEEELQFAWLTVSLNTMQLTPCGKQLPLFSAFCGIIFSVVFLCSLFRLFTFYSLNLFPINNNNEKKTMMCYQKLFCNLYKFVGKSMNSIKWMETKVVATFFFSV